MLTEIKETRQVAGEPRKRWFRDRELDLLVWLDETDDMVGFQIAFRRIDEPVAITWWKDTGLRHHRLDEGESRPGRYKATPILLAARGAVDVSGLIPRLRDADGGMGTEFLSTVVEILTAYVPAPSGPNPPRHAGTGDI